MQKRKRRARTFALPDNGVGFDDNPIVAQLVRDISGDGKRELYVARRIDRLQWLLDHKRIDEAQYAAGRRLQGDWTSCQIGTLAASTGGGGGRNTSAASDLSNIRLDALKRYGDAMKVVPARVRPALELALIDAGNYSIEWIASALKVDRRVAQERVVVALDCLAAHYGYVMRPDGVVTSGFSSEPSKALRGRAVNGTASATSDSCA